MVYQASVEMEDYKLLIQLKKKLMLIMFSERLRHYHAATRIYVVDTFCLSSYDFLPIQVVSFLKFQNFPGGSVHCPFKTSGLRALCSICCGFKGFSWKKQLNVQTSGSRAYLSDCMYEYPTDGVHCIGQLSTGECENS